MKTVADILLASTRRTPEHLALVSKDIRLTYTGLFTHAYSVGSSLQQRGFNRGDHIIAALQNHQGAAILYWACQLFGFVITPLNWRITSSEFDFFIRDCGAKAVFFDDSSENAVNRSEEAKACFSCHVSGLEKLNTAPQWHKMQSTKPGLLPTVLSEDISILLYTSGTTGPGKGVPRTHRAERAAAIAHIGQNGLSFGDISLGVMPIYHTMGIRILLTTGLLSGTFVCQPKFSAEQSLDLIEKFSVSSLYLVPTLYHDLLIAMKVKLYNLSSIEHLGFAGAPMPAGLLKRLSMAFPGQHIVNHYGSTEIYTYTINQNAALKPGSCGQAGLNAQIAILPFGSTDVSVFQKVGVEGQVIAQVDSIEAFKGYHRRHEITDSSIIDGWYLTGDVGYFDDSGDLFLTGRVDDMIITGGENVMPVGIESVLSLHEGILEAVVVGEPDERFGKKIVAYVVTSKKIESCELDAYCRESGLPGYKCPKVYVFVDKIPKSPAGKILRRLL